MAITEQLAATLDRLVGDLNCIEAAEHQARGFSFPPDQWHWRDLGRRIKFIVIDCRNSGAFLVEKATGEIYNIQGYGCPDYNKKRKADLGNIATVNPGFLHSRRWNYLR